ncbi:cytochrome P450 [Paraphoma chrysanthemicola]|uniref:Cytochrome P450 n=1 Tax=Paraphoma chrysanthemicola TaxID=798071 RepID=A0A8K0R0E2_9PLEO|nr:cytochrome P450 [Paraphoma chrysanthemicola]
MALLPIYREYTTPSPLTVLAAVALLLVVHSIGRAVYLLVFHPLAQFPGPKLAALSNLWYTHALWTKKIHVRITNAHRKYGSVVRIAPNELSFDTVTSREIIYGHSGSRHFLKSPQYDGFVNGGEPALIAVKDPVAHGKKRKFLAHAFSAAALRSHEPTVLDYCDLFIKQILQHGSGPKGVDIVQWFHWFTADIAGELAFGESFGCLRNARNHEWIAVIESHSSTIIWRNVLRRFPWVRRLVEPFLINEEMRAARRSNYAYSRDKVLKRMAVEKPARSDFMSYLLDQPDDEGMINEQFLTVSASTLIVAGSETTGSALSGIIYWLLRSPHALTTLVAELDAKYCSSEDISPQSVHELPYLVACVEEGLRMFPPAPHGPGRVSPGAEVSGYYVPKGTEVSSHPVAMNRNPEHFHDPDKFLPERWLEKTDHLDASQPFLIGPRACIGRNLANLEMRLLVAKLVFNLDMKLLDDDLDWDRDTWVDTFWCKPPLMVRVERRKKV